MSKRLPTLALAAVVGLLSVLAVSFLASADPAPPTMATNSHVPEARSSTADLMSRDEAMDYGFAWLRVAGLEGEPSELGIELMPARDFITRTGGILGPAGEKEYPTERMAWVVAVRGRIDLKLPRARVPDGKAPPRTFDTFTYAFDAKTGRSIGGYSPGPDESEIIQMAPYGPR